MAKQYPYIEAAARETHAKGSAQQVSGTKIFSKTVWKFVETFILKRGFLDGPHGLIAALGSTFAAYMKQARLWELGRKASKSRSQD
jgi:(heptosyl)LPS beta-1,4-glucosyltransferase